YTRLSDVPSKVDLALAVTSAEEAPAVLADCVQHNVKGVVLLSPRLGTHDAYSPEAAAQMRNILGSSRTRVIGPGALGVMNPLLGLNATPGLPMPMGGTVAFLCESPLLGRVVLDWSLKHLVGFSSFACRGSRSIARQAHHRHQSRARWSLSPGTHLEIALPVQRLAGFHRRLRKSRSR